MEGSDNSALKRYEKEVNRDKQRNMAAKRKASGWKGYRLQFSKTDYAKIQTLGKKLGYELPDEKASLIDISTILSYCLTVTCKHEGLIDRDLPKTSQNSLYRKRVKEVIRYRLKQEKRKSGKYQLVADFMRNAGYAIPIVSNKTKDKVPKDQQNSWCEAWIRALGPNQR